MYGLKLYVWRQNQSPHITAIQIGRNKSHHQDARRAAAAAAQLLSALVCTTACALVRWSNHHKSRNVSTTIHLLYLVITFGQGQVAKRIFIHLKPPGHSSPPLIRTMLGTIHILRKHIFRIFGHPSPPLHKHGFSTENKQNWHFLTPPPYKWLRNTSMVPYKADVHQKNFHSDSGAAQCGFMC